MISWQPIRRRRRLSERALDVVKLMAAGGAIYALSFAYGWLKMRGWA